MPAPVHATAELPVTTAGGSRIQLTTDGRAWDATCGGCGAELPTELDHVDAQHAAYLHARACAAPAAPRP